MLRRKKAFESLARTLLISQAGGLWKRQDCEINAVVAFSKAMRVNSEEKKIV